MSFGYAVGDVVAVLSLLERVALEIRNYRNAPSHFQQLQVELDLIRNSIQSILQVQPADPIEHANLQRIRAIAMQCLPPLQAFINKMQTRDSSLGHFRTTKSISAAGTRLHWSMVGRGDVDDLHKTLISQMVAITMLLGSQHLQSLRRISLENSRNISTMTTTASQHSSEVLAQTSTILRIAKDVPQAFTDMRTLILLRSDRQVEHLHRMETDLTVISRDIKSINLDVNSATAVIHRLGTRVGQALIRLFALVLEIKKLVKVLARYSKEMLEEIGRNAQMLLKIQEQMKHVIRAIESIPLQVTLPIIRFEDCFGEIWALPFQACMTYWDFRDILNHALGNNSSLRRTLETGSFGLGFWNPIQTYSRDNWDQKVCPGLHVQQNASVIGVWNRQTCFGLSCDGIMTPPSGPYNRRDCPKCGRIASSSYTQTKLTREYENINHPHLQIRTKDDGKLRQSHSASSIFVVMDEALDFTKCRRVNFMAPNFNVVQNLENAQSILKTDPGNFPANQYMGWHELLLGNRSAIRYLEQSLKSVPYNGQSWYFLARSWHHLEPGQNGKIECCYLESEKFHSTPDVGNSFAIYYYGTRNYSRSFYWLNMAVILNPSIWEAWFNLGILYKFAYNDVGSAEKTLTQCLMHNPNFDPARWLLAELPRQFTDEERALWPMLHCPLIPISDVVRHPCLNHGYGARAYLGQYLQVVGDGHEENGRKDQSDEWYTTDEDSSPSDSEKTSERHDMNSAEQRIGSGVSHTDAVANDGQFDNEDEELWEDVSD